MQKEIFYSIKIKDKNVYLMVDDNGKHVWTKGTRNAIYWQDSVGAEKFGKGYFKNYKNWEVAEIEQVI